MKRVILMILMLCLTVGLSGCVSCGVNYECMGEAEDITEIAVYDLRKGWTDTIDGNMEPMGYVDSDCVASFVQDLEDFPFVEQILLMLVPSDPSFVYGGYVVRITYEDGSCELIGTAGYQSQHAGGKYVGGSHYDCDEETWAAFVLKYLEVQS